uniref:restriction endonuclease subunit S n=1 Tax=Hafnia alvei TaxID=569 RepID=UPI00242B1210|nr:restriction endonuclease subunit S [Hafnia alvei]
MVSNIITYAVKDLVDLGIIEKPLDGNHGGIHPKSSDYVEYGIPFIMASDLINGHVDIKGCKFISEEQAKSLRKGFAKEGDVLLSHKATIGRTAVVGKLSTDFIVLTPQITYYRVLDLTRLNPRYLKYYFDSEGFQALFEQWAGGGSTRLYLGITEQMKLPIELPEIKIQNKIVNLVDSFDRKITLNRQINQTLEQMAQTLFKSWFVDFDPVVDNALDTGFFEQDFEFPDELLRRAEARKAVRKNAEFKPLPEKIRQLFPAAFEENSEASLGLGSWVPVGWEMCKLSDFGAVVCGKTPSKQNKSFYGNDIPFIKIPDMHGNAFITRTSDNLSFNGSESQIKKLIPKNSICVSCIATVGLVSITTKPAHTNQQINSLIPRYEYFRDYLYFSLLNKNKQFHDLASGGSTTLNMNTRVFSNVPLINPGNVVLQLFQKESGALLDRIKQSLHEIDVLTNLRDTLLPKLISGELRLSDSEVDTADEVLA